MIDAAQFERFYRDTLPRLEKFVVRSAGSSSDAEEIVQETYYRFLRSRFEGASDEDRRRYLYRIAVNLMKNRWSRARGEAPLADVAVHAEPAASIDVTDALARLAPRDRTMLWLAYAEGYSHQEIGEIMGIGALSVRVMLSRARKRFADVMNR